jgi:hypothetical protein
MTDSTFPAIKNEKARSIITITTRYCHQCLKKRKIKKKRKNLGKYTILFCSCLEHQMNQELMYIEGR